MESKANKQPILPRESNTGNTSMEKNLEQKKREKKTTNIFGSLKCDGRSRPSIVVVVVLVDVASIDRLLIRFRHFTCRLVNAQRATHRRPIGSAFFRRKLRPIATALTAAGF